MSDENHPSQEDPKAAGNHDAKNRVVGTGTTQNVTEGGEPSEKEAGDRLFVKRKTT